MRVSIQHHRRHSPAFARAAVRQACRIEPLEGRTLLSAAWGTVDDYQLAAGQNTWAPSMATDPQGDIFMCGTPNDASGAHRIIIREKLNGVDGWTTIANIAMVPPISSISGLAVNATGDIYVASRPNAAILERHAGETTFNMVDQNPPIAAKHGQTTNNAVVVGITIDAQKNVFVLENVDRNWTVRKQTGGVGPFSTVNSFASNLDGSADVPQGITAVASGTAQGLYEIGSSGGFPSHSIVRRSTDGGTTWSTIDTFQYSTGNNGWITRAYAIAGDANGHICIAGPASTHTLTGGTKQNPTYSTAGYWLTREGVVDAGGNWSWTVVDAYPVLGGSAPQGVVLDASGNIFTVGLTLDVNGSESATVRSNVAGTWQTDNYQLAAGHNATYTGVVADGSGTVFAGGNAIDSTGISHWIVRSPLPAVAPAAFPTAMISAASTSSPAATWGTVSDQSVSTLLNVPSFSLNKMAVDPAGNVYVVGEYNLPGTPAYHGVALRKAAGSATWTKILDVGGVSSGSGSHFDAVATDAQGDVYIAGYNDVTRHNVIWKRPAGQSNFAVVDDDLGQNRQIFDLAIDAAGNVFAVGSNEYKFSENDWIVRKQSKGQGPFTTVDEPRDAFYASATTIVASGPNAGIYVAGYSSGDLRTDLVRKSKDGGASWSVVENFSFFPPIPGTPYFPSANAMTTDTAGDVFVVGGGAKPGAIVNGYPTSVEYFMVRESTDGGAHWTLRDSTVRGEAKAAAFNPVTGTVYVAGLAVVTDSSTGLRYSQSLIRSNLGGSFATEDDFQLVAGKSTHAYGIGADASGKVYAGILAGSDSTGTHLILRSPIAPAAKLAFTTQPTTGTAGKTVSPAIVIKVEDAFGNVVTSNTSTITLTLVSGPAGGKVLGTLTAKAVNGIATFAGLSMKIAGGYVLKATDGALKIATSKTITISAAAAAKLVITQQPLTGKAAITLSPALIIKVEDIFGNVAIANTSTITLAIASAPFGGKLAGTLSLKAIKGIASFGNLSLQKKGSYVLKATDGLLIAAVSKSIVIA